MSKDKIRAQIVFNYYGKYRKLTTENTETKEFNQAKPLTSMFTFTKAAVIFITIVFFAFFNLFLVEYFSVRNPHAYAINAIICFVAAYQIFVLFRKPKSEPELEEIEIEHAESDFQPPIKPMEDIQKIGRVERTECEAPKIVVLSEEPQCPSPEPEKWDANTRIEYMGLTTRLSNGLAAAQIYTIGGIQKYGKKKLIELPYLGEATVKELEEKLAAHGITLFMHPLV